MAIDVMEDPGRRRPRGRHPAPGSADEGSGGAGVAGPAAGARGPVGGRRADRLRAAWRAGVGRTQELREAGMATAEYAIATVAAVGFAGLLVVVLRSDEVRGLLAGIVRGALSV